MYVVDDAAAYLGCLSDSFNPLLPYNPESQEIRLLKLPIFLDYDYGQSIQVRHSRVTKQPYLFEIDQREG